MKKGPLIGIIVVIALIVIIVGAILIFNKPGMNNNPTQTTNSNNKTIISSGSTTKTVTIQNFAFSPSTITIHSGDTIVWTNQDSMAHTITSDSGNELNSNALSKGQSYTHTFTTIGTYNYHCAIHSYMKATVIVQ